MRYVIVRCCLDDVLKELGLKRRHITERTGIDRRQLSRYTRNTEHMSFETAVTIAEAIGVDPRRLYVWRIEPIRP